MSFWCHCFDQNTDSLFKEILPQSLSRDQIKKVPSQIIFRLHIRKKIECLYFFLIQPLLRGWGRNPQIKIVGILVKMMTPKGDFEIEWPLDVICKFYLKFKSISIFSLISFEEFYNFEGRLCVPDALYRTAFQLFDTDGSG